MIRTLAGSTMAALAVAVFSSTPALALSPADKCESQKLKQVGKYLACRLKAEAKAIKTGTAPDYSKCDATIATKWTKIESKGGAECPTSGDQTAMQLLASECTDEVVAALAAPPAPGPRFVDNADGTISDTQTGLTWEKKTQLGAGPDPADGFNAVNKYAWHGSCAMMAAKHCQETAAAAALCHAHGGGKRCGECLPAEGSCVISPKSVWQLVADRNAAFLGGVHRLAPADVAGADNPREGRRSRGAAHVRRVRRCELRAELRR